MKIAHQDGNFYTLNFSPGEEIISGISKFAKEKNIKAGHITGLGATSKLTLGFYNLKEMKYKKEVFTEDLEILSLVGNIAIGEDKNTIIHLHGTFGKQNFSTIGGHVMELIISGAGEMHIRAFSGEIRRAHDKKTGLNLIIE
ncbi:MAG: DNA-binding protein [Candidatus Colwellbacteria bacterium]|nr:DNA-binding protein [Candidatus Colwellbacteria bacterium]